MTRSRKEVLRYSEQRVHSETLRRHYLKWRADQSPPLPIRCDNENCIFHTQKLVWNGKPLKPILDHRDGTNSDNRPEMLRLLCANCDSQLKETRGGGNVGKTKKSSGGFAKVSIDGERSYVLPVETGEFRISGCDDTDLDAGAP